MYSSPHDWMRRPDKVDNPRPSPSFELAPGDRGDAFYIVVADAWLWLTAAGEPAPAKTIADANAQKLTTVHRWLKEARRRQLLSAPTVRAAPIASSSTDDEHEVAR